MTWRRWRWLCGQSWLVDAMLITNGEQAASRRCLARASPAPFLFATGTPQGALLAGLPMECTPIGPEDFDIITSAYLLGKVGRR
jgi:hypothetical protein